MNSRQTLASVLSGALVLTASGIGTCQTLAQEAAKATPISLNGSSALKTNVGAGSAMPNLTEQAGAPASVTVESILSVRAAAAIPAWNEPLHAEAASRTRRDMANFRLVVNPSLHPSPALPGEAARAAAPSSAGSTASPSVAQAQVKIERIMPGFSDGKKLAAPLNADGASDSDSAKTVEAGKIEGSGQQGAPTLKKTPAGKTFGGSGNILPLDPNKRSDDTLEFQTALRSKIVGQDEGVQSLVDLYQVFKAGLNSPGRPVGNLLLLGPTGSGKTRIVEAAAEILFGDARSVIKVDCAEFQHSHEIAKLIGSPPGYLGHKETHPLITQEALAASHTDKLKLSFLLFDEIEKASDALWQLLLGMLDKATLTLGDNRRVDLSQTVIFLTSNLGGGEITKLMQGGMGFVQPKDKPAAGLDEKVERTAIEAARRKFSPEFMNRLDQVVVFHPLKREQLDEILGIELGQVQRRLLETAKGQFLFRVTRAGRDFLLREGTDRRYGARHLKRAIERHIVYPLANIMATDQMHPGYLVAIDWDGQSDRLTFIGEEEGALAGKDSPSAQTSPKENSPNKPKGGLSASQGAQESRLPPDAKTSLDSINKKIMVFGGRSESDQSQTAPLNAAGASNPDMTPSWKDMQHVLKYLFEQQAKYRGKNWGFRVGPFMFPRIAGRSTTIIWRSDEQIEIEVKSLQGLDRIVLLRTSEAVQEFLAAPERKLDGKEANDLRTAASLFPEGSGQKILDDFKNELDKLLQPDSPQKHPIAG